jgi:chaperonin GroES
MLKPVEDKIIVKRDVEEKVTTSGFVLAGTQDEKQGTGVVLAVGPGKVLDNGSVIHIDLEVGDRVAFSKYQGTEIEHDGEELLIIAYRDILAVIG